MLQQKKESLNSHFIRLFIEMTQKTQKMDKTDI